MSDQRRIRSELRQGLHQFLMQLYTAYLEGHSEEEAKKLVSECIQEQYGIFSGGEVGNSSVVEVLESKVKELNSSLSSQSDYDSQLFLAEKIDILTGAISILSE